MTDAPGSSGMAPGAAEPPTLYLMSSLSLYWSDTLAEAKRYPFESLTGYPVTVEAAEGMFPDARSWAAAWPALRERYSCGVFLDRDGWVSRGVYAEVCDLAGMGKRVWWFRSGEPTDRFGFGPGVRGDWAFRYRSVYALPEED